MASFAGRALDPSLPKGRAEGRLTLGATALRFEGPDGVVFELPFAKLHLERQGEGGNTLVFRAEGSDYPRLTTAESGVLDALRATGQPGVRRAIDGEKQDQRRKFRSRVLVPIASLVVLAVFVSWFVTGPLVSLVVALVPHSADVELGKVALEAALSEHGGEAKGERGRVARETARSLVEPLLAQVGETGFVFELHVVDTSLVNAFALPGGQMLVTTALLEKAPSAEAVAGVLAHEIAHVTERHGLRSLVQQLGLWALVGAVLGDVSAIVAMAMDQARTLVGLGFSRGMEADADARGVALLAKAGVDPAGLRAFFQSEALKDPGGLDLPNALSFLSTHPSTDDRIAQLTALEAEFAGAPRKALALDWRGFQRALAAAPASGTKPGGDAEPDAAAPDPAGRAVEPSP